MSAPKLAVETPTTAETIQARAIEAEFPFVEISRLAEKESWRKEIHRPLYHIHKWWATRLGSVFRAVTLGAVLPAGDEIWSGYYRRHSLRDKVVLDPFMGSGTTVGEAIKLGCTAVGCDINPISTFQVRQALTRVREDRLRAEFDRLRERVEPEIRRYQTTIDPESGVGIPVLYFFWVLEVFTPEGETVPLFSSYVFAKNAYPGKKPLARIICPGCWDVLEGRHDLESVNCPRCGRTFNPQRGPAEGAFVRSSSGERYRIKNLVEAMEGPPARRLYALLAVRANGEKIYLPAREHDRALYREAEARLAAEALPLPILEVRPGHNTDQARGYGFLHWRDFFNARQLLGLGLLLRAITRVKDAEVRDQFLCLFSSTLEFNNMFCSFKGEGTGAVRHMFSHHILKPERQPLENTVWGTDRSSGTFSTLFESRLLRAKRYLDEPFELALDEDMFGGSAGASRRVVSDPIHVRLAESWDGLAGGGQAALILNGDSGVLPIPDGVVDAVVTDPPYFDFIHYSELSDFFFAWLAPILRRRDEYFDRESSFHRGEVQHREPRFFARQLSRVFSECRRVMKDDGVLAFSFHHSRPEGWAAIHEAISASGLKFVAAHPVHAEMRAASPKTAAKEPISLDAILVCRKAGTAGTHVPNRARAMSTASRLADELQSGGMHLSRSDHFVILASQLLVELGGSPMEFKDVCALIEDVTR